jgi:hypothetical protein
MAVLPHVFWGALCLLCLGRAFRYLPIQNRLAAGAVVFGVAITAEVLARATLAVGHPSTGIGQNLQLSDASARALCMAFIILNARATAAWILSTRCGTALRTAAANRGVSLIALCALITAAATGIFRAPPTGPGVSEARFALLHASMPTALVFGAATATAAIVAATPWLIDKRGGAPPPSALCLALWTVAAAGWTLLR